jgi:hypothetical protein
MFVQRAQQLEVTASVTVHHWRQQDHLRAEVILVTGEA